MRLFAGQRDPADDTHFTVDYECDGKPGTIDGWIIDGSSIVMQVRQAAATTPAR